MTVLSASSLEGNNVKNREGEDLGDIKDIMIDCSDNSIAYYVLSFGGFMNMGDKLFAVPAEAIKIDTENECCILNASKEQLENAEGFDKDNWPNFADQTFRDRINNHYGYGAENDIRRAA